MACWRENEVGRVSSTLKGGDFQDVEGLQIKVASLGEEESISERVGEKSLQKDLEG